MVDIGRAERSGDMVNRNRSSTVWFWILLVALLATAAYGIRAVSTAEDCGDRPKKWLWTEARWECGPFF
jgi:hypothetical protein